ncbi:Coenzyme F420 hydrogenase/dehydrogenase, beta subunit C-terminal domain [Candidatus Acetatifactor stercoripullorum]|uniref:Coenzyme F420 hydrogenase/dehydrogenase, beta subunit C-terminal domain n=1 Tax=Candidatus Acetatifactor stercoripullorum TaxID=2838414 RepID=UPI00298E9D24|nr:Coenzyme F420 hydrogenase/dehydrogenase, beta subunit C-terminal domain [Candidatus Acetatifactor stercoripullorum]
MIYSFYINDKSGGIAMVGNIEKSICTGCKMCAEVCPDKAISFETDKDGFWYPVVDNKKCIYCNLCEKKCPALHMIGIDNDKKPTVFAAWSLNDKVRYDSTSGGVYFELAKAFIDSGGYIAGCVFAEDYKSAYHIVGNTIEDLKRIMGSKYFQSDTVGIYSEVKKLLSEGKKVLFCGTPCQIAAVKSFIGDRDDGLYLVDFICKGINSPKAYRAYIQELEEKYRSKAKRVRQKSKKTGWQSLATNVVFENGREYHKDRYTDWWIQGYTCGNLFMRENCQYCQYKGLPRLADLSLGDFWKIHGCKEEDMQKGVSVLFLNSDKGKYLLDTIKRSIHIELRSLDEVLEGNPYLFKQAVQKGDRSKFFLLLDSMPFSKAVKKTYTESSIQTIKRYLKLLLKKMGRKKW